MYTKKTLLTKGAITLLGVTSFWVLADTAHAEVVDLGGYSATVQTVGNKNVISTKKGKWDLKDTTDLVSRKSQTITLKNTVPVTINSIEVGNHLTMSGDGELTADNKTGQFGVSVGNDLKGFSGCGKKVGKLIGKGQEAGVRVYDDVSMSDGVLEAEGGDFGIWANGRVSAVCGAQILGTGNNSGVYSQNSYVKAEHKNSLIAGTSKDINSGYSAIHSTKKVVNAICGATIRETYNNPDFVITKDKPINIVEKYDAISRNMTDMGNYEWTSEPMGVFNTDQGFLGSVKAEYRDGTIKGVRHGESSCKRNKEEIIPLNSRGVHEVVFTGAKAKYTKPVKIIYTFNDYREDIYTLEKTVEVEIGKNFVINDYNYDIQGLEVEEIVVDKEDFIIEDKEDTNYTVNYHYEGDFTREMFE